MSTAIKFNTVRNRNANPSKGRALPFRTEKLYDFSHESNKLKKEDIHLHTAKGVHWGNLKLFTFLLQFLNLYLTTTSQNFKNYCCYVGASPGISIALASKLYPEVEFHLYDPFGGEENKPHEKFDDELKKSNKIVLYNREFTMEDADIWRRVREGEIAPDGTTPDEGIIQCVYFVSDIRRRDFLSAKEAEKSEAEKNKRMKMVEEDMLLQQEWVKIINPNKAVLKFKPFVESGKMEYLNGDIYRQAFEKEKSYETRLIVRDNHTSRKWDIDEYTELLDYHNYVIRSELTFLNPLTGEDEKIDESLGLTNDYDSCLFVITIKDMIESREIEVKERDILMICEEIINGLIRNYSGSKAKNLQMLRSMSEYYSH